MSSVLPQVVQTTCCYCGVGCGIRASTDGRGRLEIEGDVSHPVNRGLLCSKGMNLHHTVNDTSDRLLYPAMRYSRNQPRQRVSWAAALERCAAVFKALIEDHGPESVAFYASGQCLTEEYYVVNKLIKGFIGSNNLDTNSRLCMSSAVVGYKLSLGEDSVPVTFDDVDSCDTVFVAGANPAWCHPILWRRVEAAKNAKPDLKIIVSDPRVTQTCAEADLHLQLRPGTDITLHNAIGRALIETNGVDHDFVSAHADGFERYREQVFSRSIEDSARICGVNEADIRLAAKWVGEAQGLITMWAMGLNQSAVGVDKNLSLINLNLITGQIGKPGAGPMSLTGQPNAMGGREVGGLANLLPAHRDLASEHDRNEVERFWKVPLGTINAKPGLTATEMFEALNDGKLKAIWIMCTNPLVSLPDARAAERALAKAKFVVVQEITDKAETLDFADVVLPAAAWSEKSGTMTNSTRVVSKLDRLIDPPGEARPDAEIICDLAQRMGFDGFEFAGPDEIFAEHVALTEGTSVDMSGLSHEVLSKHRAVQWPYPKSALATPSTFDPAVGTPRLFTDHNFSTSNRRAQIHATPDSNLSEELSADYPLVLTTGRVRDHWHTRTKTGKVSKLNQHVSETSVQLHPLDAHDRGISDGALVEVVSARGTVRVKAEISEDLQPGVVFMPMHWGKTGISDLTRTNNLTNNVVDPRSKEPDFKFCAVQVSRYLKPRQRVVVIGAGAASHGFVRSYRQQSATDDIVVIGDEPLPYYNRVLLPDYVNGSMLWEQLISSSDDEIASLGVETHRGVRATRIDREARIVTDDQGNDHPYDVLVLSTGARAAALAHTPSLSGIFSMRSRTDADALIARLDPEGAPVVIIGGGLLGIEMASALNEMGLKISIVQRTSRLMDRQLDSLGSQLLYEELAERGIQVLSNNEVERFDGSDSVTGVRLRSGTRLACQAVLVAVGTVPNIELAIEAGLETRRGVVVDEYLRTSDPNIYAIGEIAERNGVLYGITAAAEKQASIAADHIHGKIFDGYSGSLFMNILKVHGTHVCSMGQVDPPEGQGYEEVVFIDKARRYYKKCVVFNDRLVGAIMIGDKAEFLEFRDLIEKRTELSEKRLQLLRSGAASEPPLGRIVCSCGDVGEGNIRNRVEQGCTDMVQLCQLTGAGSGCGSCRSEVQDLLNKFTSRPEEVDADAAVL